MADTKLAYGTTTAITITLDSLANGSSATSAEIDNTTDLFLDALVEVVVTTGTVGSNPHVKVYALSSVDGTNFASDSNKKLIDTIDTPASSTTYRSRAASVALAFGGVLPPKWKIVVENATGDALAASGNSAQYRGVYSTTV